MIECDICKDWFHGNCVGVQEHQASDIEIYHCPNCQLEHGPLVLKKRRNWHRHDYSETDSSKAVQTGTVTFIKELKNRNFPSADEIPILRVNGDDLTQSFLEENGFDVPILVGKKDGLNLAVPPPDFSIQDIENMVGSMREIDVIDVARQEDYKMLMREWTEYYNSPNRDKIFNVISLEFSNTKLSDLVVPPQIVRQVSWVNNLWPDQLPDDCTYSRPEVQKYCLMGVQDSFTDFHIDFGGTSVWYHVLRGEKVFYLIRPTPANMTLYENWISSSNQSETFFGDQVDNCYKSVIRDGQTLFIPTGWIHAVFTPVDTLVFGGNFLHSYNIPLQLKVYEIERHVKTPEKYLFPSFETICWYAAKYVLDILKECEEDEKRPSDYIITGSKALSQHLKSWTQRKDLNNKYIYAKTAKHDVPEHIQYGKLLKELTKISRNLEVQKTSPKPKMERKRRKKNIPTPKQMQSLDILHQHTTEKLQELQKQEHKNEEHKNVYAFSDEPSPPPTSLKMRIPKTGAFFDNILKTAKEEEENVNPVDISSLKLKVSNGRIVGDNSKPDVLTTGKFQPLVADFDDDGDSDSDQLVVDESPTVRKKKSAESNSRGGTAKAGSLKLKLSFSGKNASEDSELPGEPLGCPPLPKPTRKATTPKKEKKPPVAKTKSQTAKVPAAKKTPKKAQPKPKGKGKQAKPIDAPTIESELLPDQQLDQKNDLSHLNIQVPTELPNWMDQDYLLLKMKDDDEPQKLVIDPNSLVQEHLAGVQKKTDKKPKKIKGEPKARKGSPKKPKGNTVVQNDKDNVQPNIGNVENAVKKPKGETGKKTKAMKEVPKEEPLILAELEPLLPKDKYESPFLETKFEPLLEIKSEPPTKKVKAGSKKPKVELSPKKPKDESPVKKIKEEVTPKKKGRPKKEKDVVICMDVKPEGVCDGESPLKVASLDTKIKPVVKKGKAETAQKKAKGESSAKKLKSTAKSDPQKVKLESPAANNDGPLMKKPKVENVLDVKTEFLSSTTDPTLPLTQEKNLVNKPTTEPLPQTQQPSAMHVQTLISKNPNPFSVTPKRQDPLSLTPSQPEPHPLTPTRPDPLSLLLKKPDPLSARRPDPLSLLSNRPDPLSLTPTRPDPLSLLNKRPEPSPSSGMAKPDPLSEAFSNNKESLTAKDKSSLGSPKLESLAKKSTAADLLVNQTVSKLKKPEEANAGQDVKTKLSSKKEEEATSNWPKADMKVDQLASILKSESLLSKAKLDTLGTRIKPLEVLPAKIKEADNVITKMKPPESPVLKGKTPEGNAVKLKPPDLLGGTKLPPNLLQESKKPETLAALRAELYVKQMQAKIAGEEEGVSASKKDLSITETEQSKRMMMPTIRGGLNCGIADILEASGYGTETDFQVDEDVRAPSPTMRDAIQGMLSMSRMGDMQLFVGMTKNSAGVARGSKQWETTQAEEEEQLGVCYKDEDYIYTSLDLSDDEDQHIFKPRGKQRKDETWNPKARVSVPGEKRERMARDSAKRESMESTLAATAAKYDNLSSKPKKTNRKRLKSDMISEETDSNLSAGGHAALSHPLIAGTPVASTSNSSMIGTNGNSPVASGDGALVIDTSPVAGTSTGGGGGGPSLSSTPGTSSNGTGSGVLAQNRLLNQSLSCPSKPKKPKKGFATAKQRLGKILKIHKMRF